MTDTPERETLADFIDRLELTLDPPALIGHSSMTQGKHYRVTIRRPDMAPESFDWHSSGASEEDGEPVALVDVLDALASDAASYEDADDIDSFAAELGFDGSPPSRVIAAYDGCRLVLEQIERLIGREDLEQLWYRTERDG